VIWRSLLFYILFCLIKISLGSPRWVTGYCGLHRNTEQVPLCVWTATAYVELTAGCRHNHGKILLDLFCGSVVYRSIDYIKKTEIGSTCSKHGRYQKSPKKIRNEKGVLEVRTSTCICEHNIKTGFWISIICRCEWNWNSLQLHFRIKNRKEGNHFQDKALEGSMILKCNFNIVFYACVCHQICGNFVRDICGAFLSHSTGVSLVGCASLGYRCLSACGSSVFLSDFSAYNLCASAVGQLTHVVRK
jgi:hypothetical protein